MVLLSVLLALAAALMLYFLPIVPIEQEVDGRPVIVDGEQVIETTSLSEETGIKVLPYLAVPVLISAAAWFATRWTGRRRRRAYVGAAITQWLWIVLTGTLGLLYLVSAISLAVGAWQYVQALRREDAGPPADDGDDGDDIDEDDLEDEAFDDDEDAYDGDDGDGTASRSSVWSRLRSPFRA
jgi:hypothetical protein